MPTLSGPHSKDPTIRLEAPQMCTSNRHSLAVALCNQLRLHCNRCSTLPLPLTLLFPLFIVLKSQGTAQHRATKYCTSSHCTYRITPIGGIGGQAKSAQVTMGRPPWGAHTSPVLPHALFVTLQRPAVTHQGAVTNPFEPCDNNTPCCCHHHPSRKRS